MADTVELISSTHFHRRLELQTPSHGSLTITCADLGDPNGQSLLFIPGMFASRYLGMPLHTVAKRAGVRLLVADRPGMGGRTNVRPEQRVNAWLEIFPLLLKELGIQKVALVSHSAGTIYLLNSWAKHRDLITDTVTCLAPWVDPTHSGVTTMQIAQFIPVKLFDYWHQIPRFFITQVSPVVAGSGAVMRSLSTVSGLSGSTTTQGHSDRNFLDANYKRIQREYGIPVKESEELAKMAVKCMIEEQIVGADGEALVCLRKTTGKGRDWGVCADYNECAKAFVQIENERQSKLTLRAYFAEKDALVGDQGQRYFEKCWMGRDEDGIRFVGRTVPGTDHDTVSQAVEVWEEIFSSTTVSDG